MILTLLLVAVDFTGTPSSEAARRERYRFKKAERCMMKKINRRRDARGLPALAWDRQLGYVGRRHAKSMARNRTIFHDHDLGRKITRWRALGQNVGTGRGCTGLFRAFWRSSPHRQNILGRWRFVGVGSERRRGRLYVHHIFEWRRNPGNIYTYP
ncbi:MAG: CAP domain-containing protein [Actinomycetota bacterium]|nr:CAP domain-containing protein [Actinomycetota bacterium]